MTIKFRRLMAHSLLLAVASPSYALFAETPCDNLTKPPLESCGHEFLPSYICLQLYGQKYSQREAKRSDFAPSIASSEWATRCSHSDVPEATYNATIANRWKDGPGRAYTNAMLKARKILMDERHATTQPANNLKDVSEVAGSKDVTTQPGLDARSAQDDSVISIENSENLGTGELNSPSSENQKFFDVLVAE